MSPRVICLSVHIFLIAQTALFSPYIRGTMSTSTLIVLSDLHLADDRNILEGFHDQEQAAFEGLLKAALPGGKLGQAASTTVIINGDCFDFLAVPPYFAD